MMAPASGANTAQLPNTPKNSRITISPLRMILWLSWNASWSSTALRRRFGCALMAESAGGLRPRAAVERAPLATAHAAHHFLAGAEKLDPAFAQDKHTVDVGED